MADTLPPLPERHAMAVWISEDDALSLIMARWRLPGMLTLGFLDGVPDDATVQYVRHDPQRRCFWFVLSHPSFPVWLDGAFCPEGGRLTYETVSIRREPPGRRVPGGDGRPSTLHAWEALVEENRRLRGIFADFCQDNRVVAAAYCQGRAEERERCAHIVETGCDGFPDLTDLAVTHGINTAIAAVIRSGIDPVKEDGDER